MMPGVEQVAWRTLIPERGETGGGALNLVAHGLIARHRIGDAVAALRIGSPNPEHRAADTSAQGMLEIGAIPFDLRDPVVSFRRHTEFAQDERLVDGEGGGSAIVYELAERLWGID